MTNPGCLTLLYKRLIDCKFSLPSGLQDCVVSVMLRRHEILAMEHAYFGDWL